MGRNEQRSVHSRASGNPVPARGVKSLGPRFRGDERSEAPGTRRRLAGFARTLRDNGFKVGLAETRDALAILTLPMATRPASLKPALRSLFCATHSDWERFDDIFDAFWRGHGLRQKRTLAGSPTEARAPLRRLAQAPVPQDQPGLPDHIERRSEGDADSTGDGRGRREGASRFENLANVDMRHIVEPCGHCTGPHACGAARAGHARAARSP